MTAEWIDAFLADRCEVGGNLSFTRFLNSARDHAGVLLDGREVLAVMQGRGLVNDRSGINVRINGCNGTLSAFSATRNPACHR